MRAAGVLVSCGLAACSGGEMDDYPGDNGWPDVLDEYLDYAGSGGGEPGDHVRTFEMVDQQGHDVDYRQFLGSVHVIDIAGVWCEPCQEAARTSPELFEDLTDMRSSWLLTVLVQDLGGGPPGADDAQEWADSFAIPYPVLADELQAQQDEWSLAAWPTYLFVAPDGEIVDRADGALDDAEIVARAQAVIDAHGDAILR